MQQSRNQKLNRGLPKLP